MAEDNNLLSTIAKGGAIATVGRVAGKGLAFLFQVVVGRVFGPKVYGNYALAHTVIRVTSKLSGLGLNQASVRFGSIYKRRKEKCASVIRYALVVSFILSAGIGVTIYTFSSNISIEVFDKKSFIPYMRGFAISLPFYTVMTVGAWATRVANTVSYDIIVRQLIRPAVLLTITITSYYFGYVYKGVIYAFITSSVAGAILVVASLISLFPKILSTRNTNIDCIKILRYSITVMVTGLTSLLIVRVDKLMLGSMVSSSKLGVYNAASVVAAQLTVVLGAVSALFAPIISKEYGKGNMEAIRELLIGTTYVSLIASLPIVIFLLAATRPVLGVFGERFVEGSSSLVILSIGQLFSVVVGPVGYVLNMTGHEKLELVNTLVVLFTNIILNWLLIAGYGISGAAIATGVSIVILNTLRLGEVLATHGFFPIRKLTLRPIIFSLAVWGAFVLVMETANKKVTGLISYVGVYSVVVPISGYIYYNLLMAKSEKQLISKLIDG